MSRVEERKQRSLEVLQEYLRAKLGTDVRLDLASLPPEIRGLVEDASSEPQTRMRRSLSNVTQTLDLRWSNEFPADHPYGAQLDGQIFNGTRRLAVAELLAKNDKQNRGDLLDLLTHPERNKILVLGHAAKCDPVKAAAHIRKVLALLSPLVGQSKVGVFTEDELNQNPAILGQFLECC